MQTNNSVIVSIILIGLGFIHIAPSIGLFGVKFLTDLYGINASEANLQILMRHRAVLFGILGGFILHSVWQPEWRMIALFMALIGTASFCLLCWQVGGYNSQLQRVMRIDLVAAVAALIALWMTFSMR